MIDTHSHIDMIEDTARTVDEARLNGVEKIILPGVEPSGFHKITEIIDEYEEVYGALGVHPSEAEKFNDDVARQIVLLSHHPKIVAIGEIGLDYYWDKTFVDIQKKAFETQLEIAKSLNLPVIVHDRDAHNDVYEILKKHEMKNVVLHCFQGSVEFAQKCVENGWALGIGGVVTFKNAKKIKDVVREISLESLVLETDAPYLAPQPFRGEQNAPKYLNIIAKEIANIKDIAIEDVKNTTTKTSERIFNFNKGE